jgi:NAD+ kinase
MDKTIALYSKSLTEKTTAGLIRVIDTLYDKGITVYLNIMDPGGHHFDHDHRVVLFSELSDLPADVCMILSVGGDGTFLETAMRVRSTGIPVAGINTGSPWLSGKYPGGRSWSVNRPALLGTV